MDRSVASAWDKEYAHGRYRDEEPVAFVDRIAESAARSALTSRPGLYIGCGNGRNYIPLVRAGLDLTGLDISAVAIRDLAARVPDRAEHLIQGDIADLPSEARYAVVIGIQVFQHGDRATCHRQIRSAQALVARGGLFAVRVNATDTDVEFEHDVIESEVGAGYTVRYLEGPKAGLNIHFFERGELMGLFEGWALDGPLRLDTTVRAAPRSGQWSQWEGIWRFIDSARSA